MYPIRCACAFLLLLCTLPALGNVDTTQHYQPYREQTLSLLTGIHWQRNSDQERHYPSRIYGELGFHLTTINDFYKAHPPTTFTYGPSLEFSPGKTTIYGFKCSSWLSVSALSLGLSTVYYTDFDRGAFKIRPELGLGAMGYKLVMGINIPVTGNTELPELQKSWVQFSFNALIKTRTIQKQQYTISQGYDPGNVPN